MKKNLASSLESPLDSSIAGEDARSMIMGSMGSVSLIYGTRNNSKLKNVINTYEDALYMPSAFSKNKPSLKDKI